MNCGGIWFQFYLLLRFEAGDIATHGTESVKVTDDTHEYTVQHLNNNHVRSFLALEEEYGQYHGLM